MSGLARCGIGGLEESWDAVVVGGGPAGAVSAIGLARRGRRVLLVEKSVFPRWKVCGACLGASGMGVLERMGLASALDHAGVRAVPRVELLWRGRHGGARLRGMRTISRNAMDSALVDAAVDAGVEVRFGVRAEASADGCVMLVGEDGSLSARAAVVVQAGGLRAARGAGGSIRDGAWIGLGVTSVADQVDDGSLVMAVGDGGYVGRIVTENGRANWAAAVDPALVRACGSPAGAVARMLEGNALGVFAPAEGWVGTPALTRRMPVVDGRVVRVGDASGYVEPITGEGMSWAMVGAEALVPVVDRAISGQGSLAVWKHEHARVMRVRRLRCGLVARGLRSPAAMRAAMCLLGSIGRDGRGAVGERIVGRVVGGMIGGGA